MKRHDGKQGICQWYSTNKCSSQTTQFDDIIKKAKRLIIATYNPKWYLKKVYNFITYIHTYTGQHAVENRCIRNNLK